MKEMAKVIWILEDDPIQLKAIKSIFEKLEYQTKAFTSAVDLFQEAGSLPTPKAVLLDLALKNTLNGFEVAKRLMDEGNYESIIFIFITGWKSQFEKLRPKEFAENTIIDKANWTKDELVAAVEKISNENNHLETSE